jgi:hypothetical protein
MAIGWMFTLVAEPVQFPACRSKAFIAREV